MIGYKANTSSLEEQIQYLMRGIDLEPALFAQMKQELAQRLALGRPLRVKLGFDPKPDGLHIGHLSPLLALKRFADLGHTAYLLLGGFTARIGDPTGRRASRPILTEKEVLTNIGLYLEGAFRVLDRSRTRVVNNATWLNNMTPIEFLREVVLPLSLGRVMEHKDFYNRHHSGQHIALPELSYPAMQAYDSMVLCAARPGSEDDPEQYRDACGNPDACCDVEIGGGDQLFNLTLAREMMKRINLPSQIILTTPLILGTDSRKMSNDAQNTIAFTDKPYWIYRRIMAMDDDLIVPYFTAITTVPSEEIEQIDQDLLYGRQYPPAVKQRLAREIIHLIHTDEEVEAAEKEYEDRLYGRIAPEREVIVQRDSVDSPISVVDLVVLAKLAPNRAEAKNMLIQHGIQINGKVVEVDQFIQVEDGMIIQRGQRRDAMAIKLHLANLTE